MTNDPAKVIALAMVKDICPSCVCYEPQSCFNKVFCGGIPCPYFHPDNFYYDSELKRFWCRNWVDEDGCTKPPKAVETKSSPEHKA